MEPRPDGQQHRFRDPSSTLYDLAREDIDVRCPRCGQRAVSAPRPTKSTCALDWPRRLTCSHCAYWASRSPTSVVSRASWSGPADPFFGAPLWLQTACCGHTLWAFNRTHLDLLERFVAARLRERGIPPGGMTLVSRLPPWIRSAKNRADVLRAIGRLRASLDG